MARSVVSSVMISPTRVNSQNEICTLLPACCSTIKFATELRGVAFPASVLVLATTSQMKWLLGNDGDERPEQQHGGDVAHEVRKNQHDARSRANSC